MIVILYVMDSLRKDHLSCYGYTRETSPNIDNLAKDSAVFTEAFSQSTWTKPSGASILSSLYPSVHRTNFLNQSLPSNILTLPKFLKEKGFKTIGISSMGNISSIFGFDNGFDHFINLYEKDLGEKRKILNKDSFMWGNYFNDTSATIATSEDINDYVFKFLNRYPNENLFFFLWSIDTHDPYFHRDPKMKKFSNELLFHKNIGTVINKLNDIVTMRGKDGLNKRIDIYDDMIYYNDSHISALINKLKENGLYNDSLIVITSDHGESFNEHGFEGHAGVPYEEQIRIPLIIKFPLNRYTKNVGGLVQHIDIAPTIINSLDYETPKIFQGKNIVPSFQKVEGSNSVIFTETKLKKAAPIFYSVRTNRYKYIKIIPPKIKELFKEKSPHLFKRFISACFFEKKEKIFDVMSNFEEVEDENIVSSHEEYENMVGYLHRYHRENKEHLKLMDISSEKAKMDQKIKENLRALGYIE